MRTHQPFRTSLCCGSRCSSRPPIFDAAQDIARRNLKFAPECYLPVVPAIVAATDTLLTHSRWAGAAAALHEFNGANSLRKLAPKPGFEIEDFHCCQIFDHPIRQGMVKPRLPLTLDKF